MPAARRAIATLELLSRLPDGATLATLSRSLSMSPSSLLALLTTLRSSGYVAREGDRYRIGLSLPALGAVAAACLGVEDAFQRAREHLERGAIGSELRQVAAAGHATGGLSGDELHAFLQRPLVAVLAYQSETGYPATVPVWYAGVREPGDRVIFWLVPGPRARWAERLRHDARVSLTVSEGEPPFRRLNVEGHASVLQDGSYARDLWAEMRRRYAAAEADREPLGRLELVVRIEPTRILSWRGLTPRPRTERAA